MWIDHALRDVRYAVRVLRTSPGFTLVAVFSLMRCAPRVAHRRDDDAALRVE